MKELICFEVETTYKSGKRRKEVICSESEEKMWKYYDRHYTRCLVESSVIVDAWPQ